MNFQVIQEIRDDCVWLWLEQDGEVFLGVLTREALEDDADPPQTNLPPRQRLLIAETNKEALSGHVARRIASGEAFTPGPGQRPRVIIRTGDLRRDGILLSTSVLGVNYSWVDPITGAPRKS